MKPKNYVAVYAINFWDKRRLTRVARRLAEREGLSLVLLRVYVETGSLSDALQGCGPEEFLSYMNGARYVVTSSFHGTAYSLLFKKQFFCVIDPEMGNVRVENLLRLSDKKDRIIGYDEEFNQITPIDYSQYDVEKVLAAERERSMDYLKGLFA